jgi:aquaporin TIP
MTLEVRPTGLVAFRIMFEDALRRAVAEFIGAFTLIFIGAGAAVAANQIHDPTLIGVAIANGLAIGVMVSAMGHISGAHFNPAITFGFLITRRIKPALGVLYWVAQLAGAALAALLVHDLIPHATTEAVKLGVPAIGNGVDAASAFGLEAIMTFFLAWVIFASAVDERGTFKSIAGLAIGLTITIDVLFGGPFTGAAMNPARAFGPQLIGDYWSNAWVWYAGPIAGAAVAAILYEFLYLRPAELEAVGSSDSGVLEPRAGESA